MQMTEPRTTLLKKYKHELVTVNWQIQNIPAELRQLKQWRQCNALGQIVNGLPVKTAKFPMGGPKITDKLPGHKLTDIIDSIPDLFFGFCLTEEDEILGIDIDHLPEHFTLEDIPAPIRKILQANPTYVEISPSGQGLHAFYRTNKTLLSHRPAVDKSVDGFDGAVYIRNQFMTFTGHTYLPLAKPAAALAQMDASTLEKLILKPTSVTIHPSSPMQNGTSAMERQAPTIDQLAQWLRFIPPSPSFSINKERYYDVYRSFNPPIETPDDYEHWRIIAAAVHYGAAVAGAPQIGADLYDEWSARDPINYESSAAAHKKYNANAPKFDGTDITHLSLAKLAQASRPIWPYPELDKKGNPTKNPIPNNTYNFLALVDYLGIKLALNELDGSMTCEGNETVIERYFNGPAVDKNALATCILSMCHDTYFQRISKTTAVAFAETLMQYRMTEFNPVKQWLDSLPARTSNESEFDKLLSTLTLKDTSKENRVLYKSYIKKALMGIIRSFYYTGPWASTTGILIFTGDENAKKSSWFSQLMPKHLQVYVKASQAQMSRSVPLKEIQMEAQQSVILVRDEIESWLSTSDSTVKNFLVQTYDTYRVPYATSPVTRKRRFIIVGSTNEDQVPITDGGSRRIQIVPVLSCDTAAQLQIDMGLVYRELMDEFFATPEADQHMLWCLTGPEIEQTNELNSTMHKSEQEADIYLRECFDFDCEFDLKTFRTSRSGSITKEILVTTLRVQEVIKLTSGTTISLPALKRALQRQAGRWTDTMVTQIAWDNTGIYKGQVRVKKLNSNKDSYSGWLMPPLESNALIRAGGDLRKVYDKYYKDQK